MNDHHAPFYAKLNEIFSLAHAADCRFKGAWEQRPKERPSVPASNPSFAVVLGAVGDACAKAKERARAFEELERLARESKELWSRLETQAGESADKMIDQLVRNREVIKS